MTVDIALLMLFLIWAAVEHYDLQSNPMFGTSIFSAQERSLVETWGYLKEAAIALLCIAIAKRLPCLFYAAFAILFVSVMLDDSLGLHERVGDWLQDRAGLGKLGPLISAAVVNGGPFLLVLVGYVRLPAEEKWLATPMLLGFFLLSFFAVGVDGVHGLLARGQGGETTWSLLEDGGELLSLSAILVLTARAWGVHAEPEASGVSDTSLSPRSVYVTAAGSALLLIGAVLFDIEILFPLG